MRKLLVLMAVALLASTAHGATYLGTKTTGDTVHVQVHNWSANGTQPVAPESIFVVVYNPIGDSCYSSIVDTTAATLRGAYTRRRGNAGTVTVYNWADQVANIDNNAGNGMYQISIWIGGGEDTVWEENAYFDLVTVDDKEAPTNFGSMAISGTGVVNSDPQISTIGVGDIATDAISSDAASAAYWREMFRTRIDTFAVLATGESQAEALNGILDSLQSQDGWVAQEASLATAGVWSATQRDSVLAVIEDGAGGGKVGAILDTLQSQDGWVAQQATSVLIRDTVYGIIDTVQSQDGWIAQQATSTLIRDTVYGIIDTLQSQDGWVATAASQTIMRDTLDAIIDTLASQDGWIAQETSLFDPATDSVLASMTSLLAQLWRNVDTVHIDSSDIGDWMVNNLSGAAGGLDTLATTFVDRLTGRIADTTWLSLLAARDGVAGSFGDSAQGWGATAASSLDSGIVNRIVGRTMWSDATATDSATFDPNVDSVLIKDTTSGGYQTYSEAAPFDEFVVSQVALTGTPTTTKLISTGWTEADDYWNDNIGFIKSGNAAGQAFRITDFWTTGDSMTITPALSTAPAATDSVYILGSIWDPSGGGLDTLATTFVDNLTGRVADTVWLSLLADRDGTAGSFGDSAQGWGATAASSLDSGIVNRIVGRTLLSDATATDSAVYTLVDSVLPDMSVLLSQLWRNVDTTHIDSSDIGDWMVNNLSGASGGLDTLSTAFVDRLTGRIADTNWLSLLSARDGVAGSFGDSAQDWNNVADVSALALEASLSDGSVVLSDATYAAIADSVWDEVLTAGAHNDATSAGRRLRELDDGTHIATGTAQRGGSNYIVFAAATSFADDIVNGMLVHITGGTGEGQARVIADYTGATDSATIYGTWTTNPDGTTEYDVEPNDPQLRLRDTLAAIIDTLANQDNWVAQEGSLFDPATDSVIVDKSSFNADTNIAVDVAKWRSQVPLSLSASNEVVVEVQDFAGTGVITSTDFAAGAINAAAIATDAITAAKIAASAITVSEAPNLDAAVSTRSTFNAATDSVIVDGSALAATTDAISATTIATGAITDAEIAADAITSSELATTAIDEIWEQDSTTVTGANAMGTVVKRIYTDGSGGVDTLSTAFADALVEKVWYNIDTTNVDSSDIGDWMVNNLSGASGGLDTLQTAFVDRLTGRIADTTWLSLFAARDGVAGSFGDSAQGWGATAASSLDSGIVNRIVGRTVFSDATATDSSVYSDPLKNYVYEATWLRQGPDSVTEAAGSMMDSSTGWGATAASSLDSGIVNRIVGRTLLSDATATDSAVYTLIDSVIVDKSSFNADTNIAVDVAKWKSQIPLALSGDNELIVEVQDFAGTGVITANDFAASAITASAIATDAITAAKIAAGAITVSEAPTLDAAVSTRSTFAAATDSVLVDGSALAATADAISATTIATGAITDAEIAADAITSSELATNAVDEIWELDSTGVTGADAMGTVVKRIYTENSFNPATDSVLVNKTAFNADTSAAVDVAKWRSQIPLSLTGAGEVRTEVQDFLTNAIDSIAIATDAIRADKIEAGAIGASEIADGAIDAATFAAGAINAAAIADSAIDEATLMSGTINAAKFATGAIDSVAIARDAIGADEIATAAITDVEIGPDAITSSELATNAVDEIWEYDTSGVTGASAFGTLLKDTLVYQGGAASINYGGIDSTLTANHGSGAWTSGGLGTGAYVCTTLVIDTSQAPDDTLTNFTVTVDDYSRTRKASGSTGSDGLQFIPSLDNENLTFAARGNWYFQENGLDSVAFPAKDTNITVLVYKFTPVAPSASDSITLVFNLPSTSYAVEVVPLIPGEGIVDTSGNILLPTPIYGKPDPSTKIAQVTVVESGAVSTGLEYKITVYNINTKAVIAQKTRYTTGTGDSETVSW